MKDFRMDWDARYSIDDYLFGKDPAQAPLRHEEYLVVEGNTLVIADGEGRNSVYLAKKGFKGHCNRQFKSCT